MYTTMPSHSFITVAGILSVMISLAYYGVDMVLGVTFSSRSLSTAVVLLWPFVRDIAVRVYFHNTKVPPSFGCDSNEQLYQVKMCNC